MTRHLCLTTWFIVALSCCEGEVRAGLVISRFDTDAEGWGTIQTSSNEYASAFGNPAGSFKGVDRLNGEVWFFAAPGKFLGDQSSNYGGTLSYDIWVSSYTLVTRNVGDVYIRGNGLTLRWSGALPAADTWTTQTVVLDETGGWERSDNRAPATEAELRSVLSGLELLRIRGEYHSGRDHGYLDNVVLSPAPGPGGLALAAGAFGSLGLGGLWRRYRGRGRAGMP